MLEESIIYNRANDNEDFKDQIVPQCYESLNFQECMNLEFLQQVWIKHVFSREQSGFLKLRVISCDNPRPNLVRIFFQSHQRLIDFTQGNDMVFKLKYARKLFKIIFKDPKKYLLH